MTPVLPVCQAKISIFMGNIDEKRLSVLLERIGKIRVELDALENEVRGLELGSIEVTGSKSPVTEPADVTVETLAVTDAVTEPADVISDPVEATVPTEAKSAPTDDAPIEIDISDIDITPIIEDPAAEYAVASASSTTDDIPAPRSAEAAAVEVTEPVGETTMPEATAIRPGDDLPFDDDLPMDEPSAIPEPVQEPTLDIEPEIVTAPTHEPERTPKSKTTILDSKKAETAVMDVMAEKQAWRTDRPGSQVKNVISAISLNDRVLLINVLFRENPILFQNTISAFNGMESLDEAVSYIRANFPDWDMNSEPVYRLMMAVRRKLR